MNGVWVVARRELLVRGRSKAFRISSVVMLVAIVAGIAIPSAIARRGTHYKVAVVGGSAAAVAAAVDANARAAKLVVRTIDTTDRAAAVALVERGDADAALVGSGEIVWRKGTKDALDRVLRSAATQVAIVERARDEGISTERLARLVAPAPVHITRLHPDVGRSAEAGIAMVGMILLFIALSFYGSYVLMGVVEEKSSRVVEVLLARIRPSQLLAGKIAGIGLLGFAQFALAAVAAAVTLRIARPPDLPAGAGGTIASVVLWFVLGYALYSTVYGALGALASRQEDAQAAIAPVSVFLTLSYFGAFTALGTPEGWWVTAGSLFPPTAPMFMPIRATLVHVPLWQHLLAIGLMVGTVYLLVLAGGRVYRGAVLRTGGRVRIREAWRQATG